MYGKNVKTIFNSLEIRRLNLQTAFVGFLSSLEM